MKGMVFSIGLLALLQKLLTLVSGGISYMKVSSRQANELSERPGANLSFPKNLTSYTQ